MWRHLSSLSGKFAEDYRTRFQASSGNSDSANWPGYEAAGPPEKASENGETIEVPLALPGRAGGSAANIFPNSHEWACSLVNVFFVTPDSSCYVWLLCSWALGRLSHIIRAVHSGGAKGAVAPARKTKCFFSNIVSDFAGLFLVAILVRNLTKTEFAPADKKS